MCESSLVGVRVSFSPALPTLSSQSNQNLRFQEFDGDVNVEYGEEEGFDRRRSCGLGGVAAKAALEVFDECLKEVRMVVVRQGLVHVDNKSSKALRWHEQRVAELEVLARRLRLVLENSLHRQSL